MKPFRITLLAFWLASMLFAVEIDGPTEAEGQRTVKHKIKDLAPKAGHKWTLEALDGQDLTKVEWISGNAKSKEIHWIGPVGRYRLILETLTIADGVPDWDKAEKVVTLGKGPKPPTPDDPLTKTLRDAYAADTDSDKVKSLAFLTAAYKGMASQAKDRSDLKTNTQFVAWMKAVVGAKDIGLTPVQLKSLRTAIAGELAKAWGTSNIILSAEDAATELSKIANALGRIE